MRIIDKRMTAKAGDTITLYGLFDCHVDSKECDLKALKRDIAAIAADPNAYAILGGDFNDMIFHGDPRYAPGDLLKEIATQRSPADAVIAYNLAILEPIKDKILVYMAGNHELDFDKRHHTNVARRTADALGVPYGSYCCFLSLFFNGNGAGHGLRVDGYLHHGSNGGPVTGGSIKQTRRLGDYDFNFSMTGHIHTADGKRKVRLKRVGQFGNGRIRHEAVAMASCATYKKNYMLDPDGESGWSEQREHAPSVIGGSRVILQFNSDEGNALKCDCWQMA